MTNRFYIIIAISLLMVACVEKKDQNVRNKQVHYSNPVDSIVSAHLAFLDSVVSDKPFKGPVLLDRITESLIFMESITSVHAKVDSGPAGPYTVREEDVVRWKKWYYENKSNLKWDEETKSIFRVKDWDEQAKYINVVDSIFNAHLALLDTFVSDKLKEDFRLKYKVAQSLKFMERMTDIPSEVDFGYLKSSKIPNDIIMRWKNWYSENKANLKWNPTMKMIVRVQK